MSLNRPLTPASIRSAWLLSNEVVQVQMRDLFDTLDVSQGDITNFFISKFNQYLSNEHTPKLTINARDSRPGREGDSLLHCAARSGNLKIVRFLIEHGCDVNAINSPLLLVTPLMISIRMHNYSVAFDLIAAGAKVDTRDFSGDSIFHYFARAGSTKALKTAASQLSSQMIQDLASQPNHNGKKRKLPEDVATGLMKLIMQSYRELGVYDPPERERDRMRRNLRRRPRQP